MEDLEWYGAAVQIENRSEYEGSVALSIDWAYVEIKARSMDGAVDKLKRMLRDGVKINYCQLA